MWLRAYGRCEATHRGTAASRVANAVTTTMERRKFTIGLGALATGSAAAVGSGAFTSVTADRDLTVEVADDSDAYLRLESMEGPNANEYVNEGDGILSIDIGAIDGDDGGDGVNQNATTVIRDLFSIQNQGTQEVVVFADGFPEDDPRVSLFHDDDGVASVAGPGPENDGALSNSSNLDPNDLGSEASGGGGPERAPLLGTGDSIDNVGLLIDTNEHDTSEPLFDGTIQFYAMTEDEAESQGRL